jgi:hypothetical protein
MQDLRWCLRQTESVSPDYQLIQQLFADGVLDNLRAAQGIIALSKKYRTARLEGACRRALFFDNARYQTVKSILDQSQLATLANRLPLSSTYTDTARFLRPAAELQLSLEGRLS